MLMSVLNPIISIRELIKHLDSYITAVKERLTDNQSTSVL